MGWWVGGLVGWCHRLVGGGSGCLTLSSSHFRPPLRPAPGPAPTIPAPPNPLPADTSPEDAESQALLDEAMEMATGTPAPIRAPVRQVRSCSSLQKLAAVFACWGRVCGVASVEGIRRRAWKRGHWQQAVQLTGGPALLSSCRRPPPPPSLPAPPRRRPSLPVPGPRLRQGCKPRSTSLSMLTSPAPPQKWPTAPRTQLRIWQRPPGQHPLLACHHVRVCSSCKRLHETA